KAPVCANEATGRVIPRGAEGSWAGGGSIPPPARASNPEASVRNHGLQRLLAGIIGDGEAVRVRSVAAFVECLVQRVEGNVAVIRREAVGGAAVGADLRAEDVIACGDHLV